MKNFFDFMTVNWQSGGNFAQGERLPVLEIAKFLG